MRLIKKSTPPLLRGIGTLVVLAATTLAFAQARRAAVMPRGVPAPLLAKPEEPVIDEVIENAGFEWGGFCGTLIVASSFFVEAYLRREGASASAVDDRVEE